MPTWLLKISYIEEILRGLDKLKIKNMTINLENESEVNEIKYLTYKCKDELGDKFDKIFFMLGEESLEEISLKELQQESNITLEKLYEKYVQKKDNYDLIEGTIKSIEQNRIILYIEDQVEVVLKDYFDIGDKSFYKVGDKLGVYVLSVFNEEGKLDIEVYRNSEKCMYENISKLDMSSLSNLKLNDIEIVNNEELFITNYIGKKEEIESIESIIKNKLLLKKVIILDPLDLKIENIAKIFNVSKETIIEEARNEYIINVFNIENYTKINKLANKYKELLKSININSVKANKISIKTKYNLYHKKMDKLIEGKIKGINNNEYIIDIEPYVKARLKYVNANKKYNINDKVIAKIEVLSLDEQSIYLSVCNNYKKYVQDLLEYKIKEYKIKDMVNKIEVDENNKEIYNVKLLLNKIYDRDLIYKIKNEIEDKIDKSKVSLTILEFNDNNNDNLSTISSELNKNKVSNNNLISTEQIIKLFNKKKRECGVPEIRVIKTSRVNGYKTVILSSNLTLRNSKDNLLSLQYDMESELKGEKIKIVVFDKDVTKIIADMIEIEKKDVEINHTISSVKIYIDQKIYNNINEASEKVLLSGILPYTTYYKIDFIIKDKNLNERNIVLEEDQKQNNVDDDILGLLFK